MILLIFQIAMFALSFGLITKGILIWLENRREDNRNV